jgi:nitrite reductase (NADH) large subunit
MNANQSHYKKTIVVIGNGMVGHRFCEKLIEFDVAGQYTIASV